MNPFSMFTNMLGSMFMPIQKMGGPGLGMMADIYQNNARSGINPFSLSSFSKLGPYGMSSANIVGNRLGFMNQLNKNFLNGLAR